MSVMSTALLTSLFFNSYFSLHNSLKDRHVEVIQGEERGSKRVMLAVPPPCGSVASSLPRSLENMATLSTRRYKSKVNFNMAFVQAN